MPEEDHRFKRAIIENDEDAAKAEEEKAVENADKVREFKWDDAKEEETEGELLVASQEEVTECSSVLAKHLMSNIKGEFFGGMDTSGMRFVIPVDLELHDLLQKRFEEKWDLDSRLDMFMEVRAGLAFEFADDTEKRAELNAKIQDALPPTHRKKFTSGEVSLEDDAMVVDDESNMVSIEIPLSFAANL